MAWDPCGCDLARKATWQRLADPRVEVARMRGRTTRVHTDTRVVPHGMSDGLASDGPTG